MFIGYCWHGRNDRVVLMNKNDTHNAHFEYPMFEKIIKKNKRQKKLSTNNNIINKL